MMKNRMLLISLMLMPVFLQAQTSDPSKPGDVLLNEVMANPKGLTALPETEYIEIYNASGKSLSLKGWVFIYDKTTIALPDVTLPIGGYAVLYREGQEIVIPTEALKLGLKKFPANLANGGKHIALKNSEGHLIHAYDYPKAVAGKSHERGADNTWHLSTDPRGGTPGMVNSSPTSPPEPTPPPEPPTPPQPPVPPVQPDPSKPGDVLLNEVMANPKGLTALPETEYIEFYNASGKSLSLKGWVFIYDKTAIALPDVTLPIGGYAVLYREGREIVIPTEALKLGLKKFPANLANGGKHIALKNSDGHLIHAYDYPKAVAGKSHERGSDNTWHLCTDPRGGTPGMVNSSPTSPPEPTPPPEPPTPPQPPVPPVQPDPSKLGDVLLNEVMANPKGLTALPETEYIEIYNASGKSLSLKGWVFIYDKTAIALPDVTLPIGGYAVLYREGREIVIPTEALKLGLKKFPANLANGGKHIALKNSEGHLIHAYDYPKAVAGKSHERGADNTWHLSTDPHGGTPGMVNSSPTSPPEPTPPPEPPTPPQPPVPPVQPDPSKPGDVLLNEVMANPKGLTTLPETEYIEIYNASGKSLSLKGWVFIYDKTTIALPDITLPAGGYAVLYREGREIVIPTEALKLGLKKFPANLANSGKHIALKNSDGHLIHAYDYPKAVAGKSHERGSDNTWHLCTDPRGGTPGMVNSSPTSPPEPTPPPEPPTPPQPPVPPVPPVQPEPPIPEEPIKIEPGEIVVNEILPDPFAGGSEFIELYNRSGRTLPVNGLALAIRKANGEIGTRYPLTSVKDSLAADGYLVVTSNRSGVADFYTIPFPERIHELKLPVLHNNEATIVLLRKADSLVIDKVAYSSKWHDAAIRHIKGVSLERIRPDGASEEASNWTSAASEAGYATPGYRNSQFRDTQTDYSLAIEPPEYLHATDRYVISYRTDKTGYRCRVEVYTPNGKRVAEIVNNQLLTPNGKISWDGTGTDGSRLSPGVYIFFAELYHSDGNRRRVKKAFLVH